MRFHKIVFGTVVAASVSLASAAQPPLRLSISAEAREEFTTAEYIDRYTTFARYIETATGVRVRTTFERNLTRELVRTRSRGYDLIIGPAHVIGSAIRYGYEPLTRFPGEQHVMFIAKDESNVKALSEARTKRAAFPPMDSLATYLARGELNAIGVHAKSYFKEVRLYRYHEAALLALELGLADVAVVDNGLAKQWLSRHKGRVLLESRGAPNTGVAVLSTLSKELKERIRRAFAAPNVKAATAMARVGLDVREMEPISREEYQYVSTLGYFTPRRLDGVTIVNAEEAAQMMRRGVPLYDTRVKEENLESHIKGALSLPYKEKSPKEVGFDASKDHFEIGRIADKNAPVIFACNGPECWKSYKSCVAALKAGFKHIYWFRGGYPEWVAKGYPVESAPVSVAGAR